MTNKIAEVEAERDDALAEVFRLQDELADLEKKYDRLLQAAMAVGRDFVRWGNDVEVLTGSADMVYAAFSVRYGGKRGSKVTKKVQQEILDEHDALAREAKFSRPGYNPSSPDTWEAFLTGRMTVPVPTWPTTSWADYGSGSRAIRKVQSIVGKDGSFEYQVDRLIAMATKKT